MSNIPEYSHVTGYFLSFFFFFLPSSPPCRMTDIPNLSPRIQSPEEFFSPFPSEPTEVTKEMEKEVNILFIKATMKPEKGKRIFVDEYFYFYSKVMPPWFQISHERFGTLLRGVFISDQPTLFAASEEITDETGDPDSTGKRKVVLKSRSGFLQKRARPYWEGLGGPYSIHDSGIQVDNTVKISHLELLQKARIQGLRYPWDTVLQLFSKWKEEEKKHPRVLIPEVWLFLLLLLFPFCLFLFVHQSVKICTAAWRAQTIRRKISLSCGMGNSRNC